MQEISKKLPKMLHQPVYNQKYMNMKNADKTTEKKTTVNKTMKSN